MNFGDQELIDYFTLEQERQGLSEESGSEEEEGRARQGERPNIGFSFLLEEGFNQYLTEPAHMPMDKQEQARHHTSVHEGPKLEDCLRSRTCRREDSLRSGSRVKNETKNIPKNYGKAIIAFIEKNRDRCRGVLGEREGRYEGLVQALCQRKRSINTIQQLRSLWIEEYFKYAREMRVLSNLFLRKYALSYIYSSRITNYSSHVKYRHKLLEALKDPENFVNIKDY